jgi:hypothetical protein
VLMHHHLKKEVEIFIISISILRWAQEISCSFSWNHLSKPNPWFSMHVCKMKIFSCSIISSVSLMPSLSILDL